MERESERIMNFKEKKYQKLQKKKVYLSLESESVNGWVRK